MAYSLVENPRVVVVGGGKMGEAILSGWITSTDAPADGIRAENVLVVEPSEERREYLVQAYGIACVPSVSQADNADIVVLSVKPQVMQSVLEEIRSSPLLANSSALPLFVTIAAGLTTESISAGLPAGAAVVRVMPNMPLMVGAGASGVCKAAAASDEQLHYVADLFGCLGTAVVVDESDMDAVCALSGSGPAYVAAMIEAMRDAAASQGLDADLAEKLALQTVLGTARFIAERGMSPADTRVSICSPGGTTIAALDAMNAAGFAQVFDAGIAAAVRRSKELAQC